MAAIEAPATGKRLAALTAAALALPGMSPKAHADLPLPDAAEIDTNFSRYEENNGRMRVDVYQAVANLVVNDRFGFKVNGVKDVIAGASPLAIAAAGARNCKGPSNGAQMQCLSGASIRDVRDAVDIGASYAMKDVTLGVDVGRSNENDYSSDFFNVDARWDLNGKMTTLAAGYGYASDQVWAITHSNGQNVRVPNRGGDKFTHQGLLGVTQVLDKNSLLQANLTYSNNAGYLADPYKYVYVNSGNINCFPYYYFCDDNRPSNREQYGVLLRYVRNFDSLNAAALHLDYRFYSDTWGIDAHTFEIAWHQPIALGWRLTPRFRYYSQNSADFYQPTFQTASATGNHSSDYRLAGFGTISGGVQLSKEFFDRLRVAAGVELYQRRQDLGFSGGAGTALDNFTFSMYSVSLNLKF